MSWPNYVRLQRIEAITMLKRPATTIDRLTHAITGTMKTGNGK